YTGEFRSHVLSLVRDNALLDIRAGRFELAGRQLDRVLERAPQDAIANLHYGELHRLRAQRAQAADEKLDEEQRALARYERARELDPTFAEPYRQLGLLYFQQGDDTRAREAFDRY